ncbi:hypothetical protein ACFOW1_06185 [Parasediminibacterium paludis]|uniref:Uncharacterized protein n=1 Tax=Parasediminibacterium paludis TaxID=908966 RepID=A0ABV8PU90_9BACT
MARHDLTDWIIHFVHRRNPENDPLEFSYDFEDFEYIPHPDGFTYDGEPFVLTNKYEEDDYGLAPDDYAICVLQKILHDGYVRAGWSYRRGTPTIYGPKAAVCFTEMPLYGLIEYAKIRADENYTEQYGIAFLKDELFLAGARPVIYGLSGGHKEAKESDLFYGKGLRTLASECGIGLREQFRYVYTKLTSFKKIDWTHEREWRWADLEQSFDFPGMPIFAKNDKITFSKIIVIVKTTEEVERVIEQLKNLYHSKSTNHGREYNLKVIENTYVLSLDEVAKITKDPNLVKLDDLPLSSIPKIQKIKVTAETIEKIKIAIQQASEIFYNESEKFINEHGEKAPCGWSHVVTWESNTEITQALVDLGFANSYADGYYYINGLKSYPGQSIDVDEAGAKAAAEFLTKELGQKFSYHSRFD